MRFFNRQNHLCKIIIWICCEYMWVILQEQGSLEKDNKQLLFSKRISRDSNSQSTGLSIVRSLTLYGEEKAPCDGLWVQCSLARVLTCMVPSDAFVRKYGTCDRKSFALPKPRVRSLPLGRNHTVQPHIFLSDFHLRGEEKSRERRFSLSSEISYIYRHDIR